MEQDDLSSQVLILHGKWRLKYTIANIKNMCNNTAIARKHLDVQNTCSVFLLSVKVFELYHSISPELTLLESVNPIFLALHFRGCSLAFSQLLFSWANKSSRNQGSCDFEVTQVVLTQVHHGLLIQVLTVRDSSLSSCSEAAELLCIYCI